MKKKYIKPEAEQISFKICEGIADQNAGNLGSGNSQEIVDFPTSSTGGTKSAYQLP